MKVLIVGGGGREHVIAWKLAQSALVSEIVCAPGNAGIERVRNTRCVDVAAEDIKGMRSLATEEKPDIAVIGPEVPLALGLTDALEALGIKVFGPNKKCAQIEASKSYTKAFLERHGIPTAKYKEYENIESLRADIGIFGYPMVLKADGLAAGKGVYIAENSEAAEKAVDDLMVSKVFGEAGSKVVVEEFLRGTEASMLCFVDESAIVPMESAQDYKRIFDADRGPNTGGMGTYSPSVLIDDKTRRRIEEEILKPTWEGFRKDGLDFRGVLFAGLMLTADGPVVIEFNNRFGDPEAQSVLPRLETDLMEIILAVCENRLANTQIKWNQNMKTCCVVMAAGGYPGSYEKGNPIDGIGQVPDGIVVFHAGTKTDSEGRTVTNGGRVLGVLGSGVTHEEARAAAYAAVPGITFKDAYFRKDIGVVYNSEIP